MPLLWLIIEPQPLAGCKHAMDPVTGLYVCVGVCVCAYVVDRSVLCRSSLSYPFKHECVCVVLNWPARRNGLQLLAAVSPYRSLVLSDPSVSLSLSPSLWPSLCCFTSIQGWSRMYLWRLRSQMVCWHTKPRSCVVERPHKMPNSYISNMEFLRTSSPSLNRRGQTAIRGPYVVH